jgi:hypothetical protein
MAPKKDKEVRLTVSMTGKERKSPGCYMSESRRFVLDFDLDSNTGKIKPLSDSGIYNRVRKSS